MGLFGGRRAQPDTIGLMERIGMMGRAGQGGPSLQEQMRARQAQMLAEQQAVQQRAQEDRLRANLSPADGPNGSGTGAAPSIEQQMAALNEARLLNPAVADKFAPYVQGNQRREQARGLFGGDRRAAALWESGDEAFRKALAEGYSPQVVAAGAAQVVNGQRTVEQPTWGETGDTTVSRTSQGVQPVFTRTTPSIAERIQQQHADNGTVSANRPQITNTPQGGTTNVFGPDGSVVNTVQGNGPPTADRSAQNTAATEAIGNTRAAIGRARQQAGFWTTGPLASLPLNTPARDLNATLDTVKANLSFNELARMRANSPTGGALGSIAVRELDLLGSTVASLDQSQSKEELERSLGIIEQSLNRWESTLANGAPQGAQPQGGGSGPIAEDANGNRVQWNGQAWVPVR